MAARNAELLERHFRNVKLARSNNAEGSCCIYCASCSVTQPLIDIEVSFQDIFSLQEVVSFSASFCQRLVASNEADAVP
jgi:hypothetical protein